MTVWIYRQWYMCGGTVDVLSSVQSGGHVYYLGMGTPGVMAIVDASECPPTFGVDYGMVRGFITGGYTGLGNRHGSLASVSGWCSVWDWELYCTILYSSPP